MVPADEAYTSRAIREHLRERGTCSVAGPDSEAPSDGPSPRDAQALLR